MAKKQFKAESKRLLDLMINSIYTHKEIFLRELISNGSDAMDKLYFKSLSGDISGLQREDFEISIDVDREKRTLTVSDNGIGMDREELEKNLGTIAKSGSLAFQEEQKEQEEKKEGSGAVEDIDIIGQFGVGFYSAFMVSDSIQVVSKQYGSEQAYVWESKGVDGYSIKECEKEGNGTQVILTIKEDTEEENYSQYLEDYTIKSLVSKYSDYIRYAITMMGDEKTTLNTMVPIWKRQKSDVDEEGYNNFYKEKFHDFMDPVRTIHTTVEGVSSYTALMFVPGTAPFDYYTKEFEKGLQLYSSGVLIMEKCKELLPDYFSFVRGIVDSQDLSLNISREMLQQDRQLRSIAKNLERKIKSELLDMQKKDREKYEDFFKNFGLQLKYGIYDKMGMNKENLADLVMFHSSMEGKLVTLEEYQSKMKEDQEVIYYASGKTVEKIDRLPQVELVKDRGFEILYLTDDIDEFVMQVMRDYKGKEFKSVSAEDLDIGDQIEEAGEEESRGKTVEILEFMKEALGDKVTEVKISKRLKSHAVCLTTKGNLSLEMEKILNNMPMGEGVKAERILEINPKHDIMEVLEKTFEEDKDRMKDYAEILYNQALLIEGLTIEDPVEYSNLVCKLMI